jgi:hypothetical protein
MYAQFARLGPRQARPRQVWVSKVIRQCHRWTSIVFTATVVANFITMAFTQPPIWVVYAPLPPLFLLIFSGLTMFVSPHAAKWRARGATA